VSAIVTAVTARGPHEVGAKGWSLARAACAGLKVPPWFAIAPSASDLEAVQGHALAAAIAALDPDASGLAVRSSAVDEDGRHHSFAGQLQSFLFVAPTDVGARVAAVRRSAERAAVYREHHGLRAAPPNPAVLVQRMVRADTAGVAFSADPVSGRRGVAVVAASQGVAEELVSGTTEGDTWHVDRGGRIERTALAGARACLTEAQVREVAALARRCEQCFGMPQDIEWAFEGVTLWLLQSRPITSIAALADPDGELALWDSSNIAESYGGVTMPLTFSYIRRNYEHVYRQLLRIGGVSEAAIAANEAALRTLLGLHGGRVYYNLLSWYRLVALVPGFAHNRRFLDRMLGVEEDASRAVLQGIVEAARRAHPRPWLDRAGQAVRIAACFAGVARRNRRFHARLAAALAPREPALETLRADELVAHFRELDRQLLARWDAPLVNDFFAMIFHGLLVRKLERWCPGEGTALANDLVAGQAEIVSLEPARRLRAMARVASAHPRLARALREDRREAIAAALPDYPAFRAEYGDYLERFGDRCFEELKLESRSLREDPLPLLRAVGHLAANPGRRDASDDSSATARDAERRALDALAGHPIRRVLFRWILGHARRRVRDRENLRFERTRIYGRVRRIFGELGRRLHAGEKLESPRDVFFLEIDEVFRYVEGASTCGDLKGLAALRRAEFERNLAAEPLPGRFETRGIAFHAKDSATVATVAPVEGELRATGCCPGIVRGVARIVTDPRAARLGPGDILVAERTDPGWVVLFAAASGLVIERGSLLSHAAIVAREMGIPAVVGAKGACRWLADGDRIEIDGTKGVVRRIARSALRSAA
jgi:pyruvate,water dikinase